MSKPTDCMNDKCENLKIRGNAPEGEIGTCWYECDMDCENSKDCPMGVLISEFKQQKPKYTINDSGSRQQFSTGMVRDDQDKIRYDLIPLFMLDRFAEHLTKGAKKYSPRNWQKAETKEEMERFIASSYRHFFAYMSGEETEDHFSAIIFNLCGCEMVRAKLRGETIAISPISDIIDV